MKSHRNDPRLKLTMTPNPRHILIYEPSVDGHHVGWLRFITEDLLAAGFALTLALDTRPASLKRITDHMGDLLPKVNILPAVAEPGKKPSTSQISACLQASGAKLAFLAHFNDIASKLLRRAAFGWLPEPGLRGRLGGIYLRPQFLDSPGWSPNEHVKKAGFHRLMQDGWLNPLLLQDPLLYGVVREKYPRVSAGLLADPYPDDFQSERVPARQRFNLAEDQFILLFYGGAYKRKGLHLVAEAMLKMTSQSRAFLLCAGSQPKDARLARQLATLQAQGRAQIRNHYVFAEEEKQLFAACDAVLLPYIQHQGASAVLARAAGAGKPVVASDENYIGRIVRQYDMGPLFPSGNVSALQQALVCVVTAPPDEFTRWRVGARAFGETCSREVFRSSLVAALKAALSVPGA